MPGLPGPHHAAVLGGGGGDDNDDDDNDDDNDDDKEGEEESRTVCQFHYSAWPDHGIPTQAETNVLLRIELK